MADVHRSPQRLDPSGQFAAGPGDRSVVFFAVGDHQAVSADRRGLEIGLELEDLGVQLDAAAAHDATAPVQAELPGVDRDGVGRTRLGDAPRPKVAVPTGMHHHTAPETFPVAVRPAGVAGGDDAVA